VEDKMNDTSVPRLLRVKDVVRLTGIEQWRLYEMLVNRPEIAGGSSS
jgi:hypothetical protein